MFILEILTVLAVLGVIKLLNRGETSYFKITIKWILVILLVLYVLNIIYAMSNLKLNNYNKYDAPECKIEEMFRQTKTGVCVSASICLAKDLPDLLVKDPACSK